MKLNKEGYTMKYKCLHTPTGRSVLLSMEDNFEFNKLYGHLTNSVSRELAALGLINNWNKQGFMGGKQVYVYTLHVI